MEKLKFRVIAPDMLYARALSLELEDLGLSPAAPGSRDYQVLVAEGMCELPSQRRLKAAVFIDCGLLSAAMPEQVKVLLLERPFSLAEFRNFISDVRDGVDESEYEENALVISEDDMTVSFGDVVIKLTPREFALLSYLHDRPGETVSRTELLRNLWNDEAVRDTNVVDVYVRFLRSKLDEPLGLRLIRAVRGEGYVYAYENPRAHAMSELRARKKQQETDTEGEEA